MQQDAERKIRVQLADKIGVVWLGIDKLRLFKRAPTLTKMTFSWIDTEFYQEHTKAVRPS